MRPAGSTAVCSTMSRPAPDTHSEPRCWTCQSLADPSSALYWHIGDTAIRFARVTPPRIIGSNKWLAGSMACLRGFFFPIVPLAPTRSAGQWERKRWAKAPIGAFTRLHNALPLLGPADERSVRTLGLSTRLRTRSRRQRGCCGCARLDNWRYEHSGPAGFGADRGPVRSASAVQVQRAADGAQLRGCRKTPKL